MQKKIRRRDRTASLKHESRYRDIGISHIIGIDEVGRGPWAGPVTAAAVCLPISDESLSKKLRGVRDSKDMTALQRIALDQTIRDVAITWGIGHASAEEIDALGIEPATRTAMVRAVDMALKNRNLSDVCLFIDDMILPELDYRQVSMIEGDARSLSIAAASVIAKVARDEIMMDMDAEFPNYGFASHKGYGTKAHQSALRQFGPLPVHRSSYQPIQALLRGEEYIDDGADESDDMA